MKGFEKRDGNRSKVPTDFENSRSLCERGEGGGAAVDTAVTLNNRTDFRSC